jgi:hypothetical protein
VNNLNRTKVRKLLKKTLVLKDLSQEDKVIMLELMLILVKDINNIQINGKDLMNINNLLRKLHKLHNN